jgi:hypothetical protein
MGAWTPEEDDAFLERLSHFRNQFKIRDGLWGLFAVPIRGRVGYQCSTRYRELITEKRVSASEIAPPVLARHKTIAQKVSEPVLEQLQSEALAFIENCLALDDSAPQAPELTASSHVKVRHFVKVENLFGRPKGIPERREAAKPIMGRERLQAEEETRCPLYGVLDPLSKQPMTIPMIDRNGYVMDLTSWRKVFEDDVHPPFPSDADDESDLIRLTPRNWPELRLRMVNMAG